MNDSIGIYLNDIGKVPLLTAEDERILSRAIEKGREAAAKQAAGEKTAAVKRDIREAAKAKDQIGRAHV